MSFVSKRRIPIIVLTCILSPISISLFAASLDTKYKPIVRAIQKADYEGNRAALDVLFNKSEPFLADKEIASRVRYWRGFAKWRRAINGFNEKETPTDLESDLLAGAEEFKKSYELDANFIDGKIGHLGCQSLLAFLYMKDEKKLREVIESVRPLVKELMQSASNNPRFAWVYGPALLRSPAERGGGFDNTIKFYIKALEKLKTQPPVLQSDLDPTWGEAELLMNLSWTEQNKELPDHKAAEDYARKALKLVPNWHYVKDILLPSILESAKKAKSSGGG